MIPLIQAAVVDKNRWLRQEDFVDIIAVSQSAPGPIAVNVAVFTGYWVRGAAGAVVAAAGSAIPSFLVILGVAYLLAGFASNPLVMALFRGLRPAVLALIATAAWTIAKSTLKRPFHLSVALGGLVAVVFLRWHPIVLLAVAGLAGLAVNGWDARRGAEPGAGTSRRPSQGEGA